MGERREIRLEILPQTRGLRPRPWSNPHLIPLLARMGVGGAKL